MPFLVLPYFIWAFRLITSGRLYVSNAFSAFSETIKK
jgi:hypothetical protein